MIERIIWVAPPHVNTGYTPAIFGRLEQMDGVPFEELVQDARPGRHQADAEDGVPEGGRR